jgi:hypothetical protein
MANSRDRRALRRLLQESGLSLALKPASQPPTLASVPFWKRIPAWVYLAVGVLSIVITLLEGYPWLSIQERGFTDPANPYSQIFVVSNGGYVPLTDLDAYCYPNFKTSSGNAMLNAKYDSHSFADYLGHDGYVGIPCFELASNFHFPGQYNSGSELTIQISYAFYHLNLKSIRRSQWFSFSSILGKDGSQHWVPVSHPKLHVQE